MGMSEQSCSGRDDAGAGWCESRPPLFQLDWDDGSGSGSSSGSGACQASQFHLDVMTKRLETLLRKASFSAAFYPLSFPK
jgi:hypothetical protein